MMPHSFAIVSALVRERSGIVIGPDKLYLLQTRLAGLLRAEGLGSLDALAERLVTMPHGELARAVVEAMTTNETLFFRDEQVFAHLRDMALPALRTARSSQPGGPRLRVWSSASSTGQEAYSVAMLLSETYPNWPSASVEILGSDIARAPLARAEAGLYGQFEVQRGISAARLAQHFTRAPGGWHVRPALRAMVRFQQWNLLSDPAPLGRFDIILCRNVLIYFDAPTRSRVLAGLRGALAPDGYLYLGGAEALLEQREGFVPAPAGRSVFMPAPAHATTRRAVGVGS